MHTSRPDCTVARLACRMECQLCSSAACVLGIVWGGGCWQGNPKWGLRTISSPMQQQRQTSVGSKQTPFLTIWSAVRSSRMWPLSGVVCQNHWPHFARRKTNIKQNTNQKQKEIQITSACNNADRYMLCLKPLASIGIESLLQAEFADLAQARNCQINTRYV